MLIDTHAHLDFPELSKDIEQVIERAKKAGVEKIISVGIDETSSLSAQRMSKQFPGIVYATIGLHPHDAKLLDNELMDRFKSYLRQGGYIGIGETGLDFAKAYSSKLEQEKAFRFQLSLSKEFALPVVIHTREAGQDTQRILKSEDAKGATGVIHCFSGDYALLKAFLDLGYYISFSGIITFPRAQALRDAVKKCPLDRFFIETDSPFLAPVPKRGKTNEPSYVKYIAKEVACLKGIDFEEVCRWSSENARALFEPLKD